MVVSMTGYRIIDRRLAEKLSSSDGAEIDGMMLPILAGIQSESLYTVVGPELIGIGLASRRCATRNPWVVCAFRLSAVSAASIRARLDLISFRRELSSEGGMSDEVSMMSFAIALARCLNPASAIRDTNASCCRTFLIL